MQVTPEITATLMALCGGALGYGFREYKNRVTPFIQVVNINGDVSKTSDIGLVPEGVIKALERSFYVKQPKANATLGDVKKHLVRANEVTQMWPLSRPDVDAIVMAQSEEQMCDALAECFDADYVDLWLRLLLVNKRITFLPISPGHTEKIRVFHNSDEKCVWIDFPRKTVSFGDAMSHEAVQARCQPLLDAVRVLDLPGLHRIFEQFRTILEQEYTAALQSADELRRLLDQHSRWVLRCYIANMDKQPLMVERNATVTVVDSTGVTYQEPAYLALLKTDEKGEKYETDTSCPLVVRAQCDDEFAIITCESQGGMKLGSAMREAFERKQAKCSAQLTLRKIGLFKMQTLTTPHTEFVSSVAS